MKKMIYYALILIVLGMLQTIHISAIDRAHFYRATPFFDEPRLAKDWLTSIDVSFGGGSTKKARNAEKEKTKLLNIFGLHNMHKLGSNVPNKDLTDSQDIIPTLLSREVGRDNFGKLKFTGKFNIREILFLFSQNFTRGFFGQVYIPIRKLKINKITFEDQSPTDTACPNINTPIWQAFLNNFDAILQKHDISLKGVNRTGVGDISLLIGWTHSYHETELLDFVDTTIRVGILTPSGRQKDPDKAFDLPHGYDGHVGIPINIAFSSGVYNWVTIGGYFGSLIFFNKKKDIRMKTDSEQNGFIKLAKGEATIKKGTIWDVGTYIKADHVIRGLSFLLGYSFVSKDDDTLTPTNTAIFDPTAANSDEMLKKWKMHTVHFMAEYDFAKEHAQWGPRIGIFYNRQVSGKRTFNTNIIGGYAGLEIAWNFD